MKPNEPVVPLRARHVALALFLLPAAALAIQRAPIIGEIERITVDTSGGHFAAGVIVVGGVNVVVPRNLLVDLPAARFTLREIFDLAPPGCEGTTGLAKSDPCRRGDAGAQATILANRLDDGRIVAGDVFIAKGLEVVDGVVTFLDFTNGYFRVNGITGTDTGGFMVRINDPEGRHTIQQGPGCRAGAANCSADERFGVDPDNYTAAFITGYPLCVPSTVGSPLRATVADASGAGDAFCPQGNRNTNPVPDATRFTPLRVGDHVALEGNWESVAGVRFLSVFNVQANVSVTTRDDPTQPDYLIVAESEWDAPAFQNERARFLIIGFTSLADSQVDVFAINHDRTNAVHERPIGSTVGNAGTINQGVGAGAGGIFKIRHDVDFLGGVDPRTSPCTNLRNAGFNTCPVAPTLGEELSVISPVSREVVVRSRRRVPVNRGVVARDLNGNATPYSQYLTPVGIGHPEFVEIDLARIATPFSFDGEPWNLDRRLGPGGCDGACGTTSQPLDPFPISGLDPRLQATIPADAVNRLFEFFPFGAANRVAWPPPTPAVGVVTPTPPLGDVCAAPVAGPVPTIASIEPASGTVGQGGAAVITGTGFLPGTTCALGTGITASCTPLSISSLQVVYFISPAAVPGTRDVVVNTPGGTATLAGGFTVLPLATSAPAPVLTGTSPSFVTPGQVVDVALGGQHFLAGLGCTFGEGITATCDVTSPTDAVAHLVVAAGAAIGPRLGILTNPDGQSGALSNALQVVAVPPPTPPAPLLTFLTPAIGLRGTSLIVTLSGSNFTTGATCSFGAGIAVVSCAVVTSHTAIASLSIAPTAAAGPRDVTFVNPDLQASVLPASFAVDSAVATPPTFGTTLFSDNFNAVPITGLGAFWTTSGTWTRTAGRARGLSARGLALAALPAVTDQLAGARVQLNGVADGSGVVVRATGTSFYLARLRSSGLIQLLRVDGTTETPLGEVSASLPINTFQTLTLSVWGSLPVNLQVSFNGTAVLTRSDASVGRLGSGMAGLFSGAAARTQFDDFVLRRP